MEPLSIFFILIPIGFFTGIFAALTGIGGGIFMVPILAFGIFTLADFALETTWEYATTISNAVIIFNGISGSVAFAFQKKTDYLLGVLCSLFSIPGAILGKMTQVKGETVIIIVFSTVIILTGIRMIFKVIKDNMKKKKQNNITKINLPNPEKNSIKDISLEDVNVEKKTPLKNFFNKMVIKKTVTDSSGKVWEYNARLYFIPLAFLGGYITGIAGVGGGVIIVPLLNMLIGLPIHFSTATSSFVLIFSSLTAVITAYASPENFETSGIWWPFALGLLIGIIGGAQLGAYLAKKIKADPLKIIFAVVILGVGIWTIIKQYVLQ